MRRRRFILETVTPISALVLFQGSSQSYAAWPEAAWPDDPIGWINQALVTRGLTSPLLLGQFIDGFYYLTAPVEWVPNQPEQLKYRRVGVPKGFVTDLASIPREFYTLFRPDGQYAQAAVILDFLYWDQSRSKEEADEIFRFAMIDLQVHPFAYRTLFAAVAAMGDSAWSKNARLEKSGERRILTKFPTGALARWEDFRRDTSAFR